MARLQLLILKDPKPKERRNATKTVAKGHSARESCHNFDSKSFKKGKDGNKELGGNKEQIERNEKEGVIAFLASNRTLTAA